MMNKPELVKSISEKSGLELRDTEKLLSSFVEIITEAMQKNDTIALIGFGTFSVAKRAERIGYNFQTKKNIRIPASNFVKFKVGKTLKDSVK